MQKIRFIDLFGGIGGFRLGLERCNNETIMVAVDRDENGTSKEDTKPVEGTAYNKDIKTNSNKRGYHITEESSEANGNQEREHVRTKGCTTTFRCVWYCDNNKYAVQIYNKNFNERWKPTNIRKVDPATIPDFDMLCGGFPCQSFSIAGKRKGFQDIRGTLFFEIYRIAKAKRPRLLFLENVKGLLSADDGRCFATVISSLDELGYDVEWQVLNSKNFGVPQNRERVFIIGHLRGTGEQTVFPLRETSSGYAKELIYEGAIMSKQNKKWLEDGKELSRNFPQGQRVYSPDGIAPNICGDAGGLGGKTGLFMINAHQWRTGKYGDGVKENESFTLDSGSGRDYCVINSSVRSGGRGSLDRHKWDIVKTENKIRRLTPVECERLQGFPDSFTKEGVDEKGNIIPISDTQRYKCLGNAVSVPVITAIGKKIIESLTF